MNSLPPELLVPIIELAAECSSLYESYRARQKTLSALTLVNRQFHEIAQPLLPQQLYFRNLGEESAFSNRCSLQEVHKLTWAIEYLDLHHPPTQFGNFANLKELRLLLYSDPVPLLSLSGHTHLERFSLDKCLLRIGLENSNSFLPSLKELSIKECTILLEGPNMTSDSFFTITRFPSLRALGVKTLALFTPAGVPVLGTSDIVSSSPLPQLDCMTADTIEPRGTSNLSSSPPLPVPVLFDLDPRHMANFWGQSFLASDPYFNHSHIRIRLPCDLISSHKDIESALELADKLVRELNGIEELYLDLYRRDARGGFVMGKQLAEKIEKLEEIAREKKVGIIWENHEDDWCRSRVSKEFWRRSKAKKEKQLCRE